MHKIISTCSLVEADVAFFPFLPTFLKPVNIPHEAKNKEVIGVIKAPSIVSQRLFLKNQNGKTFCCKNKPLEFSVFTHREYVESRYRQYWEGLMFRIQKNAFPTIWAFMPEYGIEFIFNEIIKGQGMFHAYTPTGKLPAQNFLITTGERGLYSYHLTTNQLLGVN